MSTVKLNSLTPGETYSFRYPNFTDGTDYRRVLIEGVTSKDGRALIEGVDLDNGNDAKWYLDRMERVEPIKVAVIPKRAYRCQWGRREFALLVWSCYPTEDGDYRVTGKAGGEFVAMDLSELSQIEPVDSRNGDRNKW